MAKKVAKREYESYFVVDGNGECVFFCTEGEALAHVNDLVSEGGHRPKEIEVYVHRGGPFSIHAEYTLTKED